MQIFKEKKTNKKILRKNISYVIHNTPDKTLFLHSSVQNYLFLLNINEVNKQQISFSSLAFYELVTFKIVFPCERPLAILSKASLICSNGKTLSIEGFICLLSSILDISASCFPSDFTKTK